MKKLTWLIVLLPLLTPLVSAAQDAYPADSLLQAAGRADDAALRLVEAGFANVRALETPDFTVFTVENDAYKLPAEGFSRAVQILEGSGLDTSKPIKLIGTAHKIPEVTISYDPATGAWSAVPGCATLAINGAI